MTDLEKFVDLYKSFGIECKVIVREEFDFNSAHGPHKAICLGGMGSEEDTISDKLVGYSGFGAEVIFDMGGKFIEQGFYEG